MVRVVHFRTPEELVHAVRDASGYPAGRLVARERYTASPAQGSRRPVTAALSRRRKPHETAVHRWDAQSALGRPDPVTAPLAADGIAEVVELLLPLAVPEPRTGHALGTLHLHCTDTTGEWLLSMPDGRLEVTPGHAKGDAALRGEASELFLTCWGRRSGSGPEILGDKAVAQAWLALMGW